MKIFKKRRKLRILLKDANGYKNVYVTQLKNWSGFGIGKLIRIQLSTLFKKNTSYVTFFKTEKYNERNKDSNKTATCLISIIW